MKAEKDPKTGKWLIQYRYTDWQGKRRKSTKRGFATKREAEEWLRKFLMGQSVDFDMIEQKLLPYFGEKRMNNIKASDIRTWQNTLIKQGYAPTYLKNIHNQLNAIFNFAVRYYDLQRNPCTKAGSMGKNKADEMQFWTKEEFDQFIEAVMDKRMSYIAFIPKRRTPRKPFSPALRLELQRLDAITAQTRLLGREGLETAEQVAQFLARTQEQIEVVEQQRSGIYNKLRRCSDPEEQKNLKTQRDGCTQQLSQLRKDRKNAQIILEQTLERCRYVECELALRQGFEPMEKTKRRHIQR